MAKDDNRIPNSTPEQRPLQASTRLGPSLEFKGDLNGHEHTLIEGRFNGTITLPSGSLTVARGARVEAKVKVRELILHGELTGEVMAGERIQVSETGKMYGDVTSASISISNGAQFKGTIKTEHS